MNRNEFITKHWRYYLVLENEFIKTLDYVEYEPDGRTINGIPINNNSTYSNRFAMLLQSIGAELDSFFKVFCGFNQTDHKNIMNYAESILQSWPEIKDQKVEVLVKQSMLQPFKDWDKSNARTSLKWWVGFDNIKHGRFENFTDASQENTITCLAALYMLEMKMLNIICDGKEPDLPEEPSSLFELYDWNYRFLPSAEGFAFTEDGFAMVDTKRIKWNNE